MRGTPNEMSSSERQTRPDTFVAVAGMSFDTCQEACEFACENGFALSIFDNENLDGEKDIISDA